VSDMSDQDVILLVINAIPGSKTVTVAGRKFEFATIANGAVEKRFARSIKKLPHPIDFTIRRYLEDTYLTDAGKVKQWSIIYGLQLDGEKIFPVAGETMKRSRKKMEGVVFETPDLHALLARLMANAAGDIGDAGADAYKAAIKAGGECEDACEAAINAAAEAAIRKIKDA